MWTHYTLLRNVVHPSGINSPRGGEHNPLRACCAALRASLAASRPPPMAAPRRGACRPGPGGFAPLRGLNGHAGTPPSVDQEEGEKGSFRPWGSGPGGQLDAKRLVHGRSEAEPVGKGRRLQLSTRFASGARKPRRPRGRAPKQGFVGSFEENILIGRTFGNFGHAPAGTRAR